MKFEIQDILEGLGYNTSSLNGKLSITSKFNPKEIAQLFIQIGRCLEAIDVHDAKFSDIYFIINPHDTTIYWSDILYV
jgi:hypothetical protein